MGWEIVPFESIENTTDLEPESLIVGFGDDIHRALIKSARWAEMTNTKDYGKY
jgi:hypothetical protein